MRNSCPEERILSSCERKKKNNKDPEKCIFLKRSQRWIDLEMCRYAYIGQIKPAKKIWKDLNRKYTLIELHGKVADFQLLSGNRVNIRCNDVILISKMPNEIARIRIFYNYCKPIGIDTFLIIDNGSDDGTVDFLLSKPKVRLFQAAESMIKINGVTKWINHLIEQHAATYYNWCVVVDRDEFPVVPGIEKQGTKPLFKIYRP